jgi:hypothetical protein
MRAEGGHAATHQQEEAHYEDQHAEEAIRAAQFVREDGGDANRYQGQRHEKGQFAEGEDQADLDTASDDASLFGGAQTEDQEYRDGKEYKDDDLGDPFGVRTRAPAMLFAVGCARTTVGSPAGGPRLRRPSA